jgi:uncharacterized Zn finger protein (UPF0148 family)
MKEAQSMRYGGLFVQASECDYTSFKHQGLLCPCCKKTVFLVAGSERSPHQRALKNGSVREVKSAKVDAYFAHHPDTEKASVEACELRSTQITQAQKALIAAQARGQRQKALQAHCWKILKTSIKLADIDTTPKLLYSFWEQATSHYKEEKAAKRMYQLLISNLCDQFRIAGQLAHTKSTLGNGIDKWFEETQDSSFVPISMIPLFEVWRSQLDRKMQEAIACEVLDFVCQIRQNGILSALIENGIYNYILTSAAASKTGIKDTYELTKHFNKIAPDADLCDDAMIEAMLIFVSQLSRMNRNQFESCFHYVRDDVAQSIVFTDWAGEFQRLENLELARLK